MNVEPRATVLTPVTGPTPQSKLWRDSPKARLYFKAWGKVWGGPDGLIAKATKQALGA